MYPLRRVTHSAAAAGAKQQLYDALSQNAHGGIDGAVVLQPDRGAPVLDRAGCAGHAVRVCGGAVLPVHDEAGVPVRRPSLTARTAAVSRNECEKREVDPAKGEEATVVANRMAGLARRGMIAGM